MSILSSKNLSDSWRGFTKFTLLKEKPPKRYMWSGRRLTNIQTTTNGPEVWAKICKAAQNPEKQERAKEEPKFDNTRKLRGIYFFDPDDQDYKETLKHARRKLERPMDTATPCKKEIHTNNRKLAAEVTASHMVPKNIYGCIVESHESTRQ